MNIIKSRSIFQLFLILISLSLTLNSLVIIPFKVNSIKEIQIEKDYNSTNFISEYFHRDFYANLITGIPSKSILTLLDTNSHIFEFVENFLDKQSLYEIVDPENKISKSTYDSSKSLSFQNISIQHYSNAELKTASLCSETFLLYQDLSMAQTTPVEGLKFFIDEGLGNDLHIKLGLNKPTTKDYQGPPHFIQSLLDVGAIKEESWTFKFSSENEAAIALLSLNENYVYNNFIIVTFAEFNYQKNKDVTTEDDENIYEKNEILNCIKISNIFNEDIKNCLILQCKNKRTIFPSPDKIYLNDNIMKYFRKNSEIRIKSRFDFVNHEKENVKEEENVAQKIISSFVDKNYILRNLFINKNNNNNLLKEKLNIKNNILKDSKENVNNSNISYSKNVKEKKLLEFDENDEELINDIDNISSFVFSETYKKFEEIKND
jgi:hypothetical protein